MSDYQDNDTNVLTIKTVQIAPFRTLMTALKDILLETNITFQKSGISIVNMDKSLTVLVHTFLGADNFEEYVCKENKIVVGVNMYHLFKLINSIDNNDTLTIYIEEEDYSDGIVSWLGLRFENDNIKQCKTQKLKLIDPEPEELEAPDVVYPSIINLPSNDFQKIIRDMAYISTKLEIKSVGDELIFTCSGQFAKVEIRRGESDNSLEFKEKQDTDKITQGMFSLKNLGYFIKCTNLCSQIELMMDNSRPLIVKYDVASLGEIKLALTPLPSKSDNDAVLMPPLPT
jgi:proliferating cell nuclear antigen